MTPPPPKPSRRSAQPRRLALPRRPALFPRAALIRRLAPLRRQEGITMIIALGVMLVTSLLVIAAFTSARSEIHLTGADTSQKKAYYAAVAGVQDYEYHLTQDGDYLSYCTEPPVANLALNQYYKEGSEAVPMKGSELKAVEVPSTKEHVKTEESYAIQLIPAESAPTGRRKCEKNHLVESMVEEKGSATGTFRIMSTGFSGGEQRSIVATFRNANFVSYVWYSVYETGDPALDGEIPPLKPATYWDECGHFYESRPARCARYNNYFISGESVNGPMHTEDHVGICGKPIFGRTSSDRIEFGNGGNESGEGYSSESCGEAASPEFKGTHILPGKVLPITPPPGDEELEHIVEPSYEYEGETEISLEGTTMTITKHKGAGVGIEEVVSGVAYPPEGVIYVKGSCPEPYSPFGPTPVASKELTCGNVYVHGKYEDSLTIASQNDIIINGNITTTVNSEGTPTTNAMLGLVANNFVRVIHPVEKTYTRTGTKCKEETYEGKYKILDKEVPSSSPAACYYTNEAYQIKNSNNEYEAVDVCDAPNVGATHGDLKEPEIYAAVLALKHSFIVDNFDCGKPEFGNLKVYGAIAGLFSNGMTGVFSGKSVISGYGYDLEYDNRLQVEEPPHFLNPIQAAWYIQRQTLTTNP